jgi:tryptophan synthase alpha subunit
MTNSIAVGVAYSDPELDGAIIGAAATASPAGTVGFYGKTPVVQRAAALQAASVVSATSWASVVSNQAAFFAEVAATLTGLGLWKGAA